MMATLILHHDLKLRVERLDPKARPEGEAYHFRARVSGGGGAGVGEANEEEAAILYAVRRWIATRRST